MKIWHQRINSGDWSTYLWGTPRKRFGPCSQSGFFNLKQLVYFMENPSINGYSIIISNINSNGNSKINLIKNELIVIVMVI